MIHHWFDDWTPAEPTSSVLSSIVVPGLLQQTRWWWGWFGGGSVARDRHVWAKYPRQSPSYSGTKHGCKFVEPVPEPGVCFTTCNHVSCWDPNVIDDVQMGRDGPWLWCDHFRDLTSTQTALMTVNTLVTTWRNVSKEVKLVDANTFLMDTMSDVTWGVGVGVVGTPAAYTVRARGPCCQDVSLCWVSEHLETESRNLLCANQPAASDQPSCFNLLFSCPPPPPPPLLIMSNVSTGDFSYLQSEYTKNPRKMTHLLMAGQEILRNPVKTTRTDFCFHTVSMTQWKPGWCQA